MDTQPLQRTSLKISQNNRRALRNPWGLGMLGILAVFLIVNIFFIIMAYVSNPGLVVSDYYERGRAYEKNALKMLAARQRTKDWRGKLTIADDTRAGRRQIIRFTGVDGRGEPLYNANVKLFAYRPSNAAADFSQTMENKGGGMFETKVVFALQGIWDVSITIKQGRDRHEINRRISVLPP